MTTQQKKVALWIGFTVLWFVVWFAVKFLLNGSFDIWEGLIFFVIFGLIDKYGVDYIVNRTMQDKGMLDDEPAE